MAKILIEDREENTRVPFLRGILIRSLQDAGLAFKDAYEHEKFISGKINDLTTISMHLTVSRLPRRGRVSPTHGATHCIASHRIQIGPLQSLSASGMDHRERT